MKRTNFLLLTVLVVFVTVLGVLLVHPVRAVKAYHGCTNRTLFGDYGLVVSGFALVSGINKPASLVGLLHFDGEGNLTGSNIYTTVNAVVSGPSSITTGGSYVINSDCAITLTFAPGWVSQGVVVGANGSEVIADLENGSGTGTTDIKKVGNWD